MRQFQEAVDQPEFVHHLQRRGMHGVAAKIAEEVGVLFQHHDIDAGAPEQIAEHHAGRPAADDAAATFIVRPEGCREKPPASMIDLQARNPKCFQAKWTPVRVKKTRQIKN